MDLYDDEEFVQELEHIESGGTCTPELLLEFVNELGHCPTLAECKKRFGGIIGPMMDACELKKQGRWPNLPSPPKMPRTRKPSIEIFNEHQRRFRTGEPA